MRCSRAMLQDKLWSDRGPEQGSASLRQELSKIRKDWGDWAEVLEVDTRIVSLRESLVRIEEAADGPLYDGIDVRDPEFEDWLRARRQAPTARAGKAPLETAAPILLIQQSKDDDGDVIADYVRHAIGRGISDWGGVDVRRAGEDLPDGGAVPVFNLRARGQALGDGIAVRATLTSSHSGRICWQVAEFLTPSDPAALARFVNGCIDRTLKALSGARPHAAHGTSVGHFAEMQRMFQTLGRDYDQLYRTFAERFERDGRGINLALQAFLGCWAKGERQGRDLTTIQEEARALVRRAIEIEPHNALVHALGSHVFGFLLGEHGVARELSLKSTSLDKNGTLGWAFRSVANVNAGNLQEAYKDISHARSISGQGPHSLMIDSLTVFSGVLAGRAEDVLPVGQTLSALKPDYSAPLRYMLAGYFSLGDEVRARMILERLRVIEPGFELSHFAEPEYPVEALRRSNLIDVNRLIGISARQV
jgi:hypothetical protein